MASNDVIKNQRKDDEIDLLEIAGLLWQKIWLILIGFVVGAVLAFSLTKFMITPLYQADSIIYIFSKTTSITSLADLQMGSQLTGDFTIIATTREVVDSVIEELNLNTNYDTLVKNITVTNPTSSHMLKIQVKDPNPVMAANICNTLSDKLREQIADIMSTDKPSVVQRAIPPQRPASPNVVRNTEIGALIGAVLVAGILVAAHLLDDTIKTEEDIKKYLGVDVLAAFPYVRGIDTKRSGSKAASSKKKKGSSEPEEKTRARKAKPSVSAPAKTAAPAPSADALSEERRSQVKQTVQELEAESRLDDLEKEINEE